MCGICVFSKQAVSKSQAEQSLARISHRGPDFHVISEQGNWFLGFNRLAIMDPSPAGNQPFFAKDHSSALICNGEIYNFEELRNAQQLPEPASHSDCEVLLPLIEKLGFEKAVSLLDGEFALVYCDSHGELSVARDHLGIRPLFMGKDSEGRFAFASEAKALLGLCTGIAPFPPGNLLHQGRFKTFANASEIKKFESVGSDAATRKIKTLLVRAVEKRLHCDAPIGFLLSGGLDSSLVCAIAQQKTKAPIRTFSIGLKDDAIDSPFAIETANHIGSEHIDVRITPEQVLAAVDEVVYHLETFDVTTIRASIGMYLLAQYIRSNTDIKAVLTGEVSDELFGYKYTDYAPDPMAFQQEAAKRYQELYMYDVLRADRSLAAHSLEARVPFSDFEFCSYVMALDPKIKMNTYGIGKYLLRQAFAGQNYLPEKILFRDKEAFSDAVGHSLVDSLIAFAEEHYSDKGLEAAQETYTYCPPMSKEALFYREIFEKHYPNQARWIKGFWLPNQNWENCNVLDPSARVLPNYQKNKFPRK